jgi:hypothetical protein
MELLLGLGVLALGLVILLFTFSQALAMAQNPGSFLQGQLPSQQQTTQAPTADFSWASDGFNFTAHDSSSQGSAAINSWKWDFGDGSQTSAQNPGIHQYANPGPYIVTLIVRDSDNQESRTFSQVEIVPGETRSGESVGTLLTGIPNLNFDLNGILLPMAVVVLTVGMFLAMAVIGGMITKTGWNLVKPKPETIRVRIKPNHLQRAFKEDTMLAAAPVQSTTASPTPPPPPPAG